MSAPHWEVLVAIAKGGAAARELDGLLRDPALSWGELLEQALRQKMLPLLAEHALKDGITAPVPAFIARHLQTSLDVNRRRLDVFRDEAVRIAAAFAEAGISVVVTKGMSFERALYRGGGRYMNDLDFMIHPDQREIARSTLRVLGYTEGLFDWRSRAVRPHSRKRAITYQLSPDHLPLAARLTGDPVVPSVACDVANSLTWHSSEYQVPLEHALAETEEVEIVDGARIPVFAPSFQIVFTALHLFREAWLEQWIDWEQDVNLIKFADLARLWAHVAGRIDPQAFSALIRELGIAQPIAWVFEHLDRTLDTRVVATLGLADLATATLNGAAGRAGELRQWRGSMDDRLRAKDRRALFEPEEPA